MKININMYEMKGSNPNSNSKSNLGWREGRMGFEGMRQSFIVGKKRVSND